MKRSHQIATQPREHRHELDPKSKESLSIQGSGLERFPLFSSRDCAGVSPSEVDESYYPLQPTEDLPLSPLMNANLAQIGITTIGQLLLTADRKIMEASGMRKNSLASIKNAVKEYYLSKRRPSPVNYASFKDLCETYLGAQVRSSRDVAVFLDRIGYRDGVRRTYAAIGAKHHITRQRVEQILLQIGFILKKRDAIALLDPLWPIVFDFLQTGGGVRSFAEIATEISRRFQWALQPEIFPLLKILAVNDKLNIDEEREIVIDYACPCLRCEDLRAFIVSQVSGENDCLGVPILVYESRRFCRRSCKGPAGGRNVCGRPFIEFMVNGEAGLIREDDLVMTKEAWKIRYGLGVRAVIAAILEKKGRPMHYDEMIDYIFSHNPKYGKLSRRRIHQCLIGYEEFKLVRRGTYGLSRWPAKPYRPVGEGIIALLEKTGKPMSTREIITALSSDGEFRPENIRNSLRRHSRIIPLPDNTFILRNVR